jgi:hypothetical protein
MPPPIAWQQPLVSGLGILLGPRTTSAFDAFDRVAVLAGVHRLGQGGCAAITSS